MPDVNPQGGTTRIATLDDLYAICHLGVAYHIASEIEQRSGVKLDMNSGKSMMERHITSPKCIAVVSETSAGIDGFCIGVVSPWPINTAVNVAQETICYGKNIALLRKEFDAQARRLGCEVAMISCFTRTKEDRFRNLRVN